MSERRGTALRGAAALGAAIIATVAIACGEDGEGTPTTPSVVEVPASTSAPTNTGGLIDDSSDVDELEVLDDDGGIRDARSDAMIAKPVITQVARLSGNNQLTVEWGVTSTTNITDYRVQWSPGCMSSWSRKIGGESDFFTPSDLSFAVGVISPAGGNLFHRAFKVRVRARMANNTATHRKGGPWSDTTILYPGNPTDSVAFCAVGDRTEGMFGCDVNLGGQLGTLDIDSSLNAELERGGGHATLTATHAAGASLSFGGFRVEARTSPDAWEIVSLDREMARLLLTVRLDGERVIAPAQRPQSGPRKGQRGRQNQGSWPTSCKGSAGRRPADPSTGGHE